MLFQMSHEMLIEVSSEKLLGVKLILNTQFPSDRMAFIEAHKEL